MGKSVKLSDSVAFDFKKVTYPPGDVFVRKLDRCLVTTTFNYECDVEAQKPMQVMIARHHRNVIQELEDRLVKEFSGIVDDACKSADKQGKDTEKIQKDAGTKIHAKINEKYIRGWALDLINMRVANEAVKTQNLKWQQSWMKSAALKVDIKNLQHQKDVLRFFDSNKYIKVPYNNKIGRDIRYDKALFGDFVSKIEVSAKVVAKAVTDVKTDTAILSKAVKDAFDEEMDSVAKKIQGAMDDAAKLVQKAKNDKEKKSAVKHTESAIKNYLGEVEKNVAKGIGDRICELAKTMGKRRSANMMAGVSIALSIVGLAASITLLVVPVGGIGGAVAAVSLTKTILNGIKSLAAVYNTIQRLNKDARKELNKLLAATQKMVDEYKKNKSKLEMESQREKVLNDLWSDWDAVVNALSDYRLAVSTLIQKVQNTEKDIDKIIKQGEKANEKIVAEFMKDIPNEEQMRKDLDKLHKILAPVLTLDKEQKQIIALASSSLNACKEAHGIEKTMRDQIKASKAEKKTLDTLGALIMSQVPSMTKTFGKESSNMDKLEQLLKAVTLPLAAL